MSDMKNRIKILFFAFVFLLPACGGTSADEKTENAPKEELMELTQEQFSTSGMELGEPSMQSFRDEVACRGYIIAPPNSMARVSTPIPGVVNTIRCKTGDFVRIGQIVCTISGNEFLSLQQEFAETAARFSKSKLDFERAKALREEKIGSEKDFIAVQSEYKTVLASYNALKVKINAIRLDAARIENGQMYTSFPVVSPISGYVTKMSAVIGQYADMPNELVEIVNINGLQLQLSVFETEVQKLRAGQQVRFGVSGSSSKDLGATLITVGKTINPETKVIDCLARIDKASDVLLVNQSFVEAAVIVSNKSVKALPVSAVQKVEKTNFIYVLERKEGEKYLLKKTPVEVGASDNNFTEILSGLPAEKQIVVRGIETL